MTIDRKALLNTMAVILMRERVLTDLQLSNPLEGMHSLLYMALRSKTGLLFSEQAFDQLTLALRPSAVIGFLPTGTDDDLRVGMQKLLYKNPTPKQGRVKVIDEIRYFLGEAEGQVLTWIGDWLDVYQLALEVSVDVVNVFLRGRAALKTVPPSPPVARMLLTVHSTLMDSQADRLAYAVTGTGKAFITATPERLAELRRNLQELETYIKEYRKCVGTSLPARR